MESIDKGSLMYALGHCLEWLLVYVRERRLNYGGTIPPTLGNELGRHCREQCLVKCFTYANFLEIAVAFRFVKGNVINVRKDIRL